MSILLNFLQFEWQGFFSDDFDRGDGFTENGNRVECYSYTMWLETLVLVGAKACRVEDDFLPILSYDTHLLEVTGANSVGGSGVVGRVSIDIV